MKEQILLLVELQKAELEIEELLLKKVDLPAAITLLDEEVEAVAEKLAESGEMWDNLKVEHKAKEAALKNSAENTKKAKSRLLGVKTNKEYEATLKEIDAIREKNSRIEDEIIHVLGEIDELGEELKANEAASVSSRAKCENGKKKLTTELDSIDAALEGALKKRDTIRGKIKAVILKRFDAIKSRNNGKTVVPAWKEVCSGCHMSIPPQMYNELQRGESLILCPHCERIIYWEEGNENVC